MLSYCFEGDEDNNEEEMEVEEKQPKIQKKKNKGGQNQQSLGEQGKNKKQMVNVCNKFLI